MASRTAAGTCRTHSRASGIAAVAPGGSQTFSIAPRSGYRIADLSVNGASQGTLASYTFSNVAANRTISATFAALTAVENWRIQNFGGYENTGSAADDADPNGDGIVNKLEFFLARNPLAQNPPSSLPTLVRNGATLEYTYTRSISALSQFTHAVEWSDTLATGSWSSAAVTEQILSANGTVQQVKASVPAGSNSCRFLRLKVQ